MDIALTGAAEAQNASCRQLRQSPAAQIEEATPCRWVLKHEKFYRAIHMDANYRPKQSGFNATICTWSSGSCRVASCLAARIRPPKDSLSKKSQVETISHWKMTSRCMITCTGRSWKMVSLVRTSQPRACCDVEDSLGHAETLQRLENRSNKILQAISEDILQVNKDLRVDFSNHDIMGH